MKRFIRLFACAKTARLRCQLFLLVHVFILTTVASAADLVGYHATYSPNGVLYRDNFTTGTQEAIGPTGVADVRSLAVSPVDQTLYAITNSGDFYRLNTTTGIGTPIRNRIMPLISWNSLSFAPDGTLYASNSRSLYTVDTATGMASLVGSLSPYSSTMSIAIDGNGQGIGFDDGSHWLFRFDAGNASTSSLGPLTGINFSGLQFDASGQLYGWSETELYTVDPTTRSYSHLHEFTGGISHAFAIAVPEPSAGLLSGMGACAFLVARVRRKPHNSEHRFASLCAMRSS
jgi:hypothetical protein